MKKEKVITKEELKEKTSARISHFKNRFCGFITLAGLLMFCGGYYIPRFDLNDLFLIIIYIFMWILYAYLVELEVNKWLEKTAKIDIDINLKGGKK